MICQPLGHLLGPGSWVPGLVPRFNLVFMQLDFWDPDPGTRQPLGHLLGPGSWVSGPGSRTQDLGPKTRLADLFCDWFFKIGRGQEFRMLCSFLFIYIGAFFAHQATIPVFIATANLILSSKFNYCHLPNQ